MRKEPTKDPVVDQKQSSPATYKELRGHKFQKGNLSKPFGLTPLVVKLSPPSSHTVAEVRQEDEDAHRRLPETGREKESGFRVDQETIGALGPRSWTAQRKRQGKVPVSLLLARRDWIPKRR